VTYLIKRGTFGGRDCWIYEIEMRTYEMTVKYRVWYDRTTYECLKAEMSIGDKLWQTTSCGQVPAGTIGDGKETQIEIKIIGQEVITVPAGTFACTVYEASSEFGKAIYWVSDQVPIPVKLESTSEQATVTAELMEWR
jgi:hypothetical protein